MGFPISVPYNIAPLLIYGIGQTDRHTDLQTDGSQRCLMPLPLRGRIVKLAFHGVDTDTDTDTDILARIVTRMSACRSACHRNNFRKSRVSDVSARILARMSVSVSLSV